jgi:hypothetical protein
LFSWQEDVVIDIPFGGSEAPLKMSVDIVELTSDKSDEGTDGIIEAIAAIGVADDILSTGLVNVFHRTANGVWVEEASIFSPSSIYTSFGYSIALGNSTLLVAAKTADHEGVVFSYERSLSGGWSLCDTIRVSIDESVKGFGMKVL